MNIALIEFPGSNCERETALAITRAGMQPVPFLWSEDPAKLSDMDGFVIIGGFSYEDRGRAGMIAAHHPLIKTLQVQAQRNKPILGICNGAQILVESGLVPGYDSLPVCVALTENRREKQGTILGTGFYNQWVELRCPTVAETKIFGQDLSAPLRMPAAHAEGRFLMPEEIRRDLHARGCVAFQYCDDGGNIHKDFPHNPNGSTDSIAALQNLQGNVLAIMPHPERSQEGDRIFDAMRCFIEARQHSPSFGASCPAYTLPPPKPYALKEGHIAFTTALIITDNTAFSVEHCLQQAGYPVQANRYQHWELAMDSRETMEKILASAVLFNPQKEQPVNLPSASKHCWRALVRAKEEVVGKQKQQQLQHHFAIDGVHAIHHSTVWILESSQPIAPLADALLNEPLLYNKVSHDCYLLD